MKIVKLWGGLGNQMFQYVFAKKLESLTGDQIKFHFEQGSAVRKNLIDKFNVNINYCTNQELKNFEISSKLSILVRVKRFVARKYNYAYPKYYVSNHQFFDKNVLDHLNANYYDGYWQSYNYFIDLRKEIISDFTLSEKELELLKFDQKLITNQNSVSIHIRRGDYLSKKNMKIFKQCSLDYYLKSVEYFKAKIKNPKFIIFTDDALWVKENLHLDCDYDIVDGHNTDDLAHLDLYLMSICKHNIIANSTFSWWGAWLNCNNEKIVVSPKKWFVGERNLLLNELIPFDWKIID